MRLRIKFTKDMPLIYIGHLDTMRYFQKAIRRALIPVKYSEGFNPHMQMSFAMPLGVGIYSECDYFDVEVDEEKLKEKGYLLEEEKKEIDKYLTNVELFTSEREKHLEEEEKLLINYKVESFLEKIKNDLDKTMSEGISVKGAYIVPDNKRNKAMTLVEKATYIIVFYKEEVREKFINYINSKEVLIKKEKGNLQTYNGKEEILGFSILDREKSKEYKIDSSFYPVEINVLCGSRGNLNPKMLINTFLNSESLEEDSDIIRVALMDDLGRLLEDSIKI